MKALSAFIATVLIIALVIGVAGIVSRFLYGITKQQTDVTGQSADKQAKCGSAVLKIDEVKTNSSSNIANAPVNITFTYLYGTENLYNFTVYIIDSGSRINSTSSFNRNYTEASPLTAGKTAFWSISTSGWGLSGSMFSVRIVGLCQKDYPISASCDSGQPCMKS